MTEPTILFRRLEPLEDNPHALGRNVKHDARSLAFAVPVTAVADKPVEWTVAISPLDQDLPVTFKGYSFRNGTGSCTGNSGTGNEATSTPYRTGPTLDQSTGAALDEQYALQLYADATAVDPYQGTFPAEDTGSDGLSIAKVLKARGLIDSYAHILSYDAALTAIQSGPFITGTNWYQGMFTPDADGVVRIAEDDSIAGGHEYLVIGRAMVRGVLMWKFRNSWGSGFADGGDFYMEDATYRRLLSEDGDATVLHWVSKTGPSPTPDPTPGRSVQLDPDVDARVARTAARVGHTASQWVNGHLRTYFRI